MKDIVIKDEQQYLYEARRMFRAHARKSKSMVDKHYFEMLADMVRQKDRDAVVYCLREPKLAVEQRVFARLNIKPISSLKRV